jgi:hypothetical protein
MTTAIRLLRPGSVCGQRLTAGTRLLGRRHQSGDGRWVLTFNGRQVVVPADACALVVLAEVGAEVDEKGSARDEEYNEVKP